jgi:hypothetical protein
LPQTLAKLSPPILLLKLTVSQVNCFFSTRYRVKYK